MMVTSQRAGHDSGSREQTSHHANWLDARNAAVSGVIGGQASKSPGVSTTGGDSATASVNCHIVSSARNFSPPVSRQHGGEQRAGSMSLTVTGSQYCTITGSTITTDDKDSLYRNRRLQSSSFSPSAILFSLVYVALLVPVAVSLKADVSSDDVTGLRAQGQQHAATNGRVVQLSPCGAVIDDRLVNLQPLQSINGTPRFVLQLDSEWKMSFNPCMSYNLPTNPSMGLGDQCHYVAACKYRETNSTLDGSTVGEFFTLGLQRTSLFQLKLPANGAENTAMTSHVEDVIHLHREQTPALSSQSANRLVLKKNENETSTPEIPANSPPSYTEPSDDEINEEDNDRKTSPPSKQEIKPVLVLRGIRSMKRRKVFINLVCDYKRHLADDALFTIAVYTPANSSHYHFDLHHRCCCPDGCPVNLRPQEVAPVYHDQIHEDPVTVIKNVVNPREESVPLSTPSSVSPASEPGRRSAEPRHLWIVLVVNGCIIFGAVMVAALCCRRGGGLMATGPYTYIPALHASRGTVNSIDPRGQLTSLMSGVKSMGGLGMSVGLGSTQAIGGGSGIIGGTVSGPGPKSSDYRDYSTSIAPSSRLPQLENCVISSHALEIGQRLGGGLFGDTYICEWKSRNVAAKRITVGVHQTQIGAGELEWIADTVSILSKQRHVNLAAVIGVCFDMKQPYVITEFVDGDTLRDVVRRAAVTPDSTFNWPSKIKVCIQIADGMAFLHSAKRPVLHRDLRCANVIVDRNGKVKIADFGLTRIIQRLRNECDRGAQCYCRKEQSALPASIRWTAPEVLMSPRSSEDNVQSGGASAVSLAVMSPSCDVYSFAMLLWELATCSDPFEDVAEEAEVVQLVLDGTRPSFDKMPRGTVQHFKDLMKRCWDQNPDGRPQFKQVALYLKTILQVVNKLSSQPYRDRSDSIHSTTTSIYLRSVFNVGNNDN